MAGTESQERRQSIFITGAASGIGRATAELFAGKGWLVGGVDVDESGLDSLRSELGECCFISPLDVSDKPAYDEVIDVFAEHTGGTLDILFNNAGIGGGGWLEDMPYDVALRIIQINFIGVVNGVYAALPLLTRTPNSLCFSTSSSAAIYGLPKVAIYAASKFAVKGLTESLSAELVRHDIRAADVLPGLVDTPLLDATPDYSGGEPPGVAMRRTAAAEGPMRMMKPEDVANCVLAAYSSDRLHWYIPEELGAIETARAGGVEGIRGSAAKDDARRGRRLSEHRVV